GGAIDSGGHAKSSTRCGRLVGVQRFELWTPGSQNRCSTRLSYTPKSRPSVSLFGKKGQGRLRFANRLDGAARPGGQVRHVRSSKALAARPRSQVVAAVPGLYRRHSG